MADKKNALQRAATHGLDQQRDNIRLKAADRGVDAVADMFTLLIKFGNVAAEGQQLDLALRKTREESWTRIQEMDAQTKSEIDKMTAALKGEMESTKRLQILVELIVAKGHDLPEPVAAGIGAAIENCTKKA